MQDNNKRHLFKKIVKKDYKNELEEVLEKKYFGENAKSLLLEILYKIEIAYKDYEIVKKDCDTKDEYIKTFIDAIRDECNTIKIVQPKSEQSKILDNKTFKINKEKGEIICLPIARKLLYAISKLQKKEKIISKKYYLLSKTFSDMVIIGDSINTVEPLRDFNGWSWATVSSEYESIEYNLIYQIMLILVGKKYLNSWLKNGDSIIDYLEEFENILINEYGMKTTKELMHVLYKIAMLMEFKVNPNIREEIENEKNTVKENLNKFYDKMTYIEDLTLRKNQLNQKIKDIDKIVGNKELLNEEYIRRNELLPLEEKIFSMRILADIMSKERIEYYKEMEECNSLLIPQTFLEKKEELEKELYYIELANSKDEKKELEEKMLTLQKSFLKCFRVKIVEASNKQELINLFYQFRYYVLLPYNNKQRVFEVSGIKNILDEVCRSLIKRATETNTMAKFFKDEDLNYKIIKNLFKIRTITLDDISLKIVKENEEYYLQFFDDKTYDEKIKIKINEEDKKELNFKLNKKMKIFE